MHVLIPYAISDEAAARALLRPLQLPHLQALLQTRRSQPALDLPADSPISAHEHLQAQALGLDPQAPAWAALRAHELGLSGAGEKAWSFLTPCHWEPGQTRVTLRDPQALDLHEDESRALLAAMQPYFAEDGLALHYEQPLRWLVSGEPLRGLATAMPGRVIGRNVAPWLPASPLLRRLQNEMQMLLYTHAVSEARAERGALAVNSLWFGGSGALAAMPAPAQELLVFDDLAQPAVRGDWAAWAQAWPALDARLEAVQRAHETGQPVTLTLCSELSATRYAPAPRGLLTRLRQRLRPIRLSDILVAA